MRKLVLPISVLLVCPMIMAGGNSLSADDIAKIKRVHALYQEAWLRGDAGGVRAVFSDDCVLLPPHGDIPRIGQKGLNEYWFPPNAPSTQITKLVVTPQSIGGDGQIAMHGGRTKWRGRQRKTERQQALRTPASS
ncbi:MAG: hypothetical protein AUI12_03750 [Acidobacteria bacterium 13_2_20CM_2_57_6]|nr:MAG: hypothetical protein AUH16_04320 [Acidobacteria bacterium 13_2_20CM_57_7]OLB88894.1 MAG: hypothetical protein AUI12_03750 [Acidobacteria bacterium 13_2_20CM_2_57_6]PYT42584.1 MAG: hypothetical protein DMG45_09345 [Acidobacteriota bacterium]PYT42930.1 MAG: hypothetical protein DMG47_14580 [Acidobacteriota bacterium]PYT58217.1 MAG: hypothetical protein DMG46_11940 [Acidobacteriota bacterium]